jgi:chromosome segregation ATPase
MTSPVNDWMAKLAAAQPAEVLLRLTNVEAQLTTLTVAVAASVQQIHNQEVAMATTDEQVAAVKANLDNITGDVSRLTSEIERVQAELEQVDPALAEKLQPLVDQSRAIADATPEPAPADGGDEPTPQG